jgi:hypothetical protein
MPAEPRNVGQQWCKPAHPSVHRDVIHLDAALGQ